jgi:hypothetical protein
MKYHVIIISLFFVFCYQTKAQNATATISTEQSCDMTEVIVSVDIQDFFDVGALSIYITFDTLAVTYVAVENVHPAFPGLLYNYMVSPTPQIGFSWSGITGANVAAGKFCDIRFLFKTGQTPLAFSPWCEVVTSGLDEIPVNYTNGFVSSLISIIQQPQDFTVDLGNMAQFIVISDGAQNYQWQISADSGNTFQNLEASTIYTGVNTPELKIIEADNTLDGMAFRCILAKDDCQLFSEMAFLQVSPAQLQQTISLNAGWNGFSFSIDPNCATIQELLDLIPSEVIFFTDGISIYFPGGNLNTFQNLDPTKAFLIKTSGNATVEISGTAHENTIINIPQGWSLMPVLSAGDQFLVTFFENHADDVEIVKEVAGAGVFWPQFGVNMLQYLRGGKAYYIKSKNSFTINFNE